MQIAIMHCSLNTVHKMKYILVNKHVLTFILNIAIKVGEPRPITIMTSTTGKPDAPCRVMVTNPRGQAVELPTRKIPEGYTATLAPQEVGPHRVNVNFDNKEVPKSPFNVMAEPAIDFSKVKVTGLEKRKYFSFIM